MKKGTLVDLFTRDDGMVVPVDEVVTVMSKEAKDKGFDIVTGWRISGNGLRYEITYLDGWVKWCAEWEPAKTWYPAGRLSLESLKWLRDYSWGLSPVSPQDGGLTITVSN